MEIKWSSGMVNDLCEVVRYLKGHEIGKVLEVLGNYFIKRHVKKLQMDKYTMDFIEPIDSEKIGDGEYKLAFICELVSFYAKKKRKYGSFHSKTKDKKKEKKNKEKKDNNNKTLKKAEKVVILDKNDNYSTNVYSCIGFMIKYCISHLLKFHPTKFDYKTSYLISIVSEKIKLQESRRLELLQLIFYIVQELIEYKDDVYSNVSLISHCENLDLSICSNIEIREICEILKVKRSLFVRVLLVISYEFSKSEDILHPLWLNRNVKCTSLAEFSHLTLSPLIEVFLFLTSKRIENLSD